MQALSVRRTQGMQRTPPQHWRGTAAVHSTQYQRTHLQHGVSGGYHSGGAPTGHWKSIKALSRCDEGNQSRQEAEQLKT